MGPPCGKFVVGSPDVFINGRAATFIFGSMARCDKDSGLQPLATVKGREIKLMIPITFSEVEFKKVHGLDSREEVFDKSAFNNLDPQRPSVV